MSDAADASATWAARQELGAARTAYAMLMGCVSAAVAAGYLLDRATSSTPPAERRL